jgi:hypothetical protein
MGWQKIVQPISGGNLKNIWFKYYFSGKKEQDWLKPVFEEIWFWFKLINQF